MNKSELYIVLAASAGLAFFAYSKMNHRMADHHTPAPGDPLVTVNLPLTLSSQASAGKTKFEANCAACHGLNASGNDGAGPPLVHKIYEPSHHADESFQIAASRGVRSHHWRFGNMPPVADVTRDDVAMIIAYIRELQRENGIY